MCCMRHAANTGCKKVAKNRYLGTISQLCRAMSSQLRHVSKIRKKNFKQQYLPYMSPQYGELGPLAAEIVSLVWGTPANFNGFRVLASLLQQRRSTELRKSTKLCTPALVRYIYTFGISCPQMEFCHVQNSLCVHLCTIAQVSQAISSQLRHLSTIGKNLLNSNMYYRCPYNMGTSAH